MWGKGGASDFVLCGVVLGGASCFGFRCGTWEVLCVFGLYLGFRRGTWEVLCVLRDLKVEVLGGSRNGVKA